MKRPIQPERALALGFLFLILLGGLLLALPFSGAGGCSVGVRGGMFTAVSAVCVTGLTIVDAGTQLSPFGQAVLLVLIQVGGLGFMIFATLIMAALGRKTSLKSRLLIRDSLNLNTLGGVAQLAASFFGIALAVETAGALMLMTRLIPLYGAKGVWYSFFTSVSAFCNAGFDVFGGWRSLTHLTGEPVILLTLAMLILLGGLGFSVILECLHHRFRFRALSLHARLVLSVTGALLLWGAAWTLLLEHANPETLGPMSLFDKLVNSLFQSVTLRTAGFAALNQSALTDASKLSAIGLMFVGASPASTGGGVKTTTAFTLILMLISVIRGRERIQIWGREISQDTARRSMVIVLIGVVVAIASAGAISIWEQGRGFGMLDLLFETMSAFSTTGLSSANTVSLHPASQWMLMPLMYLGRVGPLTLAFALARRTETPGRVRYPEEKIMIG